MWFSVQKSGQEPGVSRRGLLGAAGTGVAGVGLGAVGMAYADRRPAGAATGQPSPVQRSYPFYGEHQAGIVTPAQDRLHFAAFDVTTSSRDELVSLLRDWTAAAARMTQGGDAGEMGATTGSYDAHPTTPARRSGCRPRG